MPAAIDQEDAVSERCTGEGMPLADDASPVVNGLPNPSPLPADTSLCGPKLSAFQVLVARLHSNERDSCRSSPVLLPCGHCTSL